MQCNIASEKSAIQIHGKESAFMMSDFREGEQKSRIFVGQYHTKTTMLHEVCTRRYKPTLSLSLQHNVVKISSENQEK